jgi:hypothetical protein
MTKTIECALGLSALLAVVGCYNANSIDNGGLLCGKDNSCPAGFACVTGHCWKNGVIVLADAGGSAPDASSSKTDTSPVQGCAVGGAPVPYGPFATCSPNQAIPNSTCDPVCQAGCPCKRRCVLDSTTNSSFVCEASEPPATTPLVQPLEACNGNNVGLCAPGSVCTDDGVCQFLCHKTCRTDLDCGSNSRCTASGIETGPNQTVANLFFCSPPIETCNPTGSATCGAARANFNCVFLAGLTGIAKTDSTVCDCSTLHNVAVGLACNQVPDNCQPGSACVNGFCRSLCNQKTSGSACPSGGGCTPINGSATYGYCR